MKSYIGRTAPLPATLKTFKINSLLQTFLDPVSRIMEHNICIKNNHTAARCHNLRMPIVWSDTIYIKCRYLVDDCSASSYAKRSLDAEATVCSCTRVTWSMIMYPSRGVPLACESTSRDAVTTLTRYGLTLRLLVLSNFYRATHLVVSTERAW